MRRGSPSLPRRVVFGMSCLRKAMWGPPESRQRTGDSRQDLRSFCCRLSPVRCRLGRAAFAGRFALGGFAGDEFVEKRLFPFGAEDAAEALDVLAGGGGAADDDGDVGVRDINALIKHAAGDEFGVLAGAEPFEDAAAL